MDIPKTPDFGKKITRLNDLELRKITQNRKKFGVFTKDPITTKDTLINKINYTIELISKHDLNSTSKKSKKKKKNMHCKYNIF